MMHFSKLMTMLTGLSDDHVIPFEEHHFLHKEVYSPFVNLQKAAAKEGFTLKPVSTFRHYHHQKRIWDNKFSGISSVLDRKSQPMDIKQLSEAERCQVLLFWSAVPGASRHHWGTDIDIFDPTCLPENYSLQLIPQEYTQGGYFYSLSQWLTEHMSHFGFYTPYLNDRGYTSPEPWHISYQPLAQQFQEQLTPVMLMNAWQQYPIAGQSYLCQSIETLFQHYIQLS